MFYASNQHNLKKTHIDKYIQSVEENHLGIALMNLRIQLKNKIVNINSTAAIYDIINDQQYHQRMLNHEVPFYGVVFFTICEAFVPLFDF